LPRQVPEVTATWRTFSNRLILNSVKPAFAAYVKFCYEAKFNEPPKNSLVKVSLTITKIVFSTFKIKAKLAYLMRRHPSIMFLQKINEDPAGFLSFNVRKKNCANILIFGNNVQMSFFSYLIKPQNTKPPLNRKA
jgi:hypothetical protein